MALHGPRTKKLNFPEKANRELLSKMLLSNKTDSPISKQERKTSKDMLSKDSKSILADTGRKRRTGGGSTRSVSSTTSENDEQTSKRRRQHLSSSGGPAEGEQAQNKRSRALTTAERNLVILDSPRRILKLHESEHRRNISSGPDTISNRLGDTGTSGSTM